MEPQEQPQTTQQSSENKPYKMEPHMEAAFSYILAPLTGILVLMVEKENRFVRFHAMQSTVFGIVAIVAYVIAQMLIPLVIGLLILPFLSIGLFVVWLVLVWNAYNKKEFELPYLGKIAREQLNKY